MNKMSALSIFAACAALALIGCAAPEDEVLDGEEDTGTAVQAINDPPLGYNNFDPPCWWSPAAQQAYRILGNMPVNQGTGTLPVLNIPTACRDGVIKNLIQCALSQSQAITDPVTGVVYRGHWGIATSWWTQPLTTSQRRYVTGCMVQRLNAFDQTVPILLEANSPGMYRDLALDAQYPWDESTVWGGDAFSSTAPLGGDTPPFTIYACSDSDLLGACTGPNAASQYLEYRMCDSTPNCGLTVMGPCSNVCANILGSYPFCQVPGGWWAATVHVQLTGGTCPPVP